MKRETCRSTLARVAVARVLDRMEGFQTYFGIDEGLMWWVRKEEMSRITPRFWLEESLKEMRKARGRAGLEGEMGS